MRTGTGARGLCPSPPSHWAPGGRIKKPAGCPASPRPQAFWSIPPPPGPATPRGSSLGRWKEERDPGAGELSHHGLLHSQVFPSLCLSFPPDSKV